MSNSANLTVPSTKAQIAKIQSSDDSLEKFLLLQVSLNDDGVYYEPDCAVCSSPRRKEVEEDWLTNRDAKVAADAFKSHGEPIPLTVVKNHMEYHIDQSYVELRKREYIKKVITLSDIHLDTVSRVELGLSAIMERIVAINASEDSASSQVNINKVKADSTCKLVSSMSSLLQLRANLLGEMQQTGEVLAIKKEDFTEAFNSVLTEHTSSQAREAVNDLLSRFLAVSKKQ